MSRVYWPNQVRQTTQLTQDNLFPSATFKNSQYTQDMSCELQKPCSTLNEFATLKEKHKKIALCFKNWPKPKHFNPPLMFFLNPLWLSRWPHYPGLQPSWHLPFFFPSFTCCTLYVASFTTPPPSYLHFLPSFTCATLPASNKGTLQTTKHLINGWAVSCELNQSRNTARQGNAIPNTKYNTRKTHTQPKQNSRCHGKLNKVLVGGNEAN